MGKVPENMFTDTDVNSAEPSFNESKYKSTAIPRPTTKCKTRIRTKTNDFIERHNDEFKRLFGRKSGLGEGFLVGFKSSDDAQMFLHQAFWLTLPLIRPDKVLF